MKNLTIFFILLLILSSCNKDDSTDDKQSELSEFLNISGAIILPDENQNDTNLLKVQSIAGLSDVINNEFEITVAKNETNTLYVVDQNEKVVLMGYYYPNQTDFTINSESTLIAMMMSLPISQTLNINGKESFLNTLKLDPEFQNLKSSLENLINQGFSPLDTNQETFAINLISFFEEVANRSSQNQNDQPVTIFQQNREFIFQNPGKTYTSYVGIYKDNQRLESLKIDRVKFVPTSISQILLSIFDNYADDIDIIEEAYTLPSDNGVYDIRIRTGRQLSSADDYEGALALGANIKDIAMDIFLDLLSYENRNLDCAQTLINNFDSFLGTVDDFQNINSAQDCLSFTYDKTLAFITTSENVFSGCNPPNESISSYLKSIEKKIFWLKWIGALGNSANFSIVAYQWFTDEAIVDKCYFVNDNDVAQCILGTWNISGIDNCVNGDGSTFQDTYEDIITFNEDGTVTVENDINDNGYDTNEFNFDGNTLIINLQYEENCDNQSDDYILVIDSWSFNYDTANNTFSGSGTTTKTGSSGQCSNVNVTCQNTATIYK
jgi:hypothetical protein